MSVHKPYADLDYAIQNFNENFADKYMIYLGRQGDFKISSMSNWNSDSSSDLGWTYTLPLGIKNGT